MVKERYYRVAPKAHSEQNGNYLRLKGKKLEMFAGEGSIDGLGARIIRGEFIVDSKYLVQSVTKSQAETAKEDERCWHTLVAYVY
jgi:hypothetical protein